MKISNYKVMVEGNVTAQALVSAKPLSFWGGVEPSTGMIKDVHHDLCGENLTGKVLCIPFDRGSCSGSGVLFEMIRAGNRSGGNPVYRSRGGIGVRAGDRTENL